jgi:hypothetical protein
MLFITFLTLYILEIKKPDVKEIAKVQQPLKPIVNPKPTPKKK